MAEWTQWYPNAQRRSRGRRAWDEASHSSPREGTWTFWYENGVVLGQGLYHAGRREGHWDYSLDDGTLDGDRTGEYHDDLRLP
jgi:antitoxin component YwqK of YwqJK toxin-antitoxin module